MTFRIRIAVGAGLVVGAIATATIGPSAAAPSPKPPAPVAVVSETLNVFQTGSSVGPGVIKGIVVTAIGQPLPAPLNIAQQAVINAINTASTQISTQGPTGINRLRAVLAPLACANPVIDAAINAVADGLDAGATQLRTVIQPVDLTAHQTATLLRGFTAPKPTGC